ncbi:thymidylate kinase-like [Contarinia nasturtii]|uniref:thymidylate kinase-like n=1 Tax=Contarinia nasturtii TaxID=265458 RepID=UPI0012D4BD32|nr:thymidylate kinase-like [Contarinia nasturtii]
MTASQILSSSSRFVSCFVHTTRIFQRDRKSIEFCSHINLIINKQFASNASNMCKKIPLRGALIVLEGCDRSGKTTQCKQLVKALVANGRPAKYINFPDRTTECGALINSFLTNKKDFNDETIHLLFTLNRWEAKMNMEKMLQDGVTLIVDRYAYSGVAFSAAKGLDIEWCKAPETGLIKPDLVLLLTMTASAISKRGGFGDERYEVPEFQQRVMKVYDELKDDSYWKDIDADKSFNDLHEELLSHCNQAIDNISNEIMDKLW